MMLSRLDSGRPLAVWSSEARTVCLLRRQRSRSTSGAGSASATLTAIQRLGGALGIALDGYRLL